jgi:glycosyltransferase involved in cell wall biosynthesis
MLASFHNKSDRHDLISVFCSEPKNSGTATIYLVDRRMEGCRIHLIVGGDYRGIRSIAVSRHSMPEAIRILHVVHSLEHGGMEHVLTMVAGQLAPRGFDIRVCCLDDPGQLAERLPDGHVHALHRQPGIRLATVTALRSQIRRIRPHLLHTHNYGPLFYGAPASLWGLTVPILHGEHAQFTPEQQASRHCLLCRLLYTACRQIHTVSSSQCQELLDLFPGIRRKLVPIVNGVDANRFAPGDKRASREGLGLPADLTLVGIVGRFRPVKRHVPLVEAMASVPDTMGLVVIGDGPERPAIEAAVAASPARDRIFLIGHQDNPLPALQSLDLLAIPSVAEGLSNALLEAMACGVPALANDACGNSEAIVHGENGWVVPMPDSTEIARHLREAVADPVRLAAFGRAARQHMLDHFAFEHTVDRYEALYRKVTRRE